VSDPDVHRRELYSGFGDASARAFELAARPVIAALAGRWIDARVGTRPAAMIALVVIVVIASGAQHFFRYKTAIEDIERDAPWSRSNHGVR
jgi:F0F1-type ATP synthase assembly protein I